MYFKLGQACVTNWGSFVLLQIRENVVTNWGSFIVTNSGKCCSKLGQLLQIRATVITKQGSYWGKMYYKLGQVLQIRAIITNWGVTDGLFLNQKANKNIRISYSAKYKHLKKNLYEKIMVVQDEISIQGNSIKGITMTYNNADLKIYLYPPLHKNIICRKFHIISLFIF